MIDKIISLALRVSFDPKHVHGMRVWASDAFTNAVDAAAEDFEQSWDRAGTPEFLADVEPDDTLIDVSVGPRSGTLLVSVLRTSVPVVEYKGGSIKGPLAVVEVDSRGGTPRVTLIDGKSTPENIDLLTRLYEDSKARERVLIVLTKQSKTLAIDHAIWRNGRAED